MMKIRAVEHSGAAYATPASLSGVDLIGKEVVQEEILERLVLIERLLDLNANSLFIYK